MCHRGTSNIFLLLLAVSMVTACGGGGQGGSSATTNTTSTGTSTPPPASQPPAPVASLVSFGTISRFGSVYSNGIRFDTAAATVTVNGEPATLDQLRTGEIARIVAGPESGGVATGRSVAVEHAVVGPVQFAPGTTDPTLVLDQKVLFDGMTTFDGFAGPNPGVASLAAGETVTVSGLRFTEGPEPYHTYLYATRVARGGTGSGYLVRGPVANHDAVARTFEISLLHVNYASASPQPGALANDDCVLARGATLTGGNAATVGTLVATTVTRVPCLAELVEGDRVLIEGRSSPRNTASETIMLLGTQRVSADASGTRTAFEFRPPTDLSYSGIHVRADGTATAATSSGIFANRVQILGQREFQVRVRGLANSSGTDLTVLGVPIVTLASTRYEDATTAALRTIGPSELRTGDVLDVRGYQIGDTNSVRAMVVTKLPAGGSFELRGYAAQPARPSFSILGVPVTTDAGTEWRFEAGSLTNSDWLFQNTTWDPANAPRLRVICNAPCTSFRPDRIVYVTRTSGW